MLVLEEQDRDLYDRVQEQNLIRQYDLLTNCIEIGLKQGPTAFDKYMLWALNHVAVANICQFGGRYRREPIYVGDHKPPHYEEVPDWMDRMISNIHENWFVWSPTEVAAYGLWRLNWIHPFIEGNGRTARAACYYLLSVRSGTILKGRKTLPERIRENREGYERALKAADVLGTRVTSTSPRQRNTSPHCSKPNFKTKTCLTKVADSSDSSDRTEQQVLAIQEWAKRTSYSGLA